MCIALNYAIRDEYKAIPMYEKLIKKLKKNSISTDETIKNIIKDETNHKMLLEKLYKDIKCDIEV